MVLALGWDGGARYALYWQKTLGSVLVAHRDGMSLDCIRIANTYLRVHSRLAFLYPCLHKKCACVEEGKMRNPVVEVQEIIWENYYNQGTTAVHAMATIWDEYANGRMLEWLEEEQKLEDSDLIDILVNLSILVREMPDRHEAATYIGTTKKNARNTNG